MSVTSLIQDRLRALQYFDPDGFDTSDEKKFRNLVFWIENQKIRHYPFEKRGSLGNVDGGQAWEKAFERYLQDLNCDTSNLVSKESRLLFLLGQAVRTEFQERVDDIDVRIPLDRKVDLIVETPDFAQKVSHIAKLLKLQEHPDPLITLEICCNFMAKASLKSNSTMNGQRVDLNDHNLAIPPEYEGQQGLCQALKVLRLVHLKELRHLQNQINNAIESIQKLTANPKTDAKLGKVGR